MGANTGNNGMIGGTQMDRARQEVKRESVGPNSNHPFAAERSSEGRGSSGQPYFGVKNEGGKFLGPQASGSGLGYSG
jgi:hypothetical protein